jgi:hypothetical protein
MHFTERKWNRDADLTDKEGGGEAAAAGPVTEARFRTNIARYLANPGVKFLQHRFPTRWIIDNHEVSSSWDHTPANAQLYSGGGTQSQFDTNATYQNAVAAHLAAHSQMGAIYETGTGDVPPEAVTGAPGNHTADYYPPRWGSERVKDCEFFYLDTMGGKHPASDLPYDDSTKKLLGDNQRAWFDSALQSAQTDGVDFKIVLCGKVTYADVAAGTGQGWDNYQYQLEQIVDTYTTAGVKGVLWVCGDAHHPRYFQGAFGNDFAAITAGPGNADNPGSQAAVPVTPVPLSPGNATIITRKTDAIEPRHFSYVHTSNGNLTAKIIDQFGDEVFIGTMISTSNDWQTISTP